MLVYGNAGLICKVDYAHQRSFGTKIDGAVSHSGDILNQRNREGRQTMTVTLEDLVHSCFFSFILLSLATINIMNA